jgi:hypothetical protein
MNLADETKQPVFGPVPVPRNNRITAIRVEMKR